MTTNVFASLALVLSLFVPACTAAAPPHAGALGSANANAQPLVEVGRFE